MDSRKWLPWKVKRTTLGAECEMEDFVTTRTTRTGLILLVDKWNDHCITMLMIMLNMFSYENSILAVIYV